MIPSEIIPQFRTDIGKDENQVPDSEAIVFLNRVRRKLINSIRMIDEDYFYTYLKTPSVSGQGEYSLPKRWDLDSESNPIPWMVKIKGISVKYKDTDTEYKKLRPTTFGNLEKDLFWYEEHQPIDDPFYIVQDNSYFIYPKPTESAADRVILYWIQDPLDVTTSSTQDDMKVPQECDDVIPLGMKMYYYGSVTKINEKNDAKVEYETELRSVMSYLSDRVLSPLYSEMLDLTYYQ